MAVFVDQRTGGEDRMGQSPGFACNLAIFVGVVKALGAAILGEVIDCDCAEWMRAIQFDESDDLDVPDFLK